MPFVKFMRSSTGRSLQVFAGVAMIGAGVFLIGGRAGTVLGIAGLLPIAAGLMNLCFLAPLFGASISGRPTARSTR